jgi:hypothetical protein
MDLCPKIQKKWTKNGVGEFRVLWKKNGGNEKMEGRQWCVVGQKGRWGCVDGVGTDYWRWNGVWRWLEMEWRKERQRWGGKNVYGGVRK